MILICYDGSADAQAAIDQAGLLMAGNEATVLGSGTPSLGRARPTDRRGHMNAAHAAGGSPLALAQPASRQQEMDDHDRRLRDRRSRPSGPVIDFDTRLKREGGAG
jgi:hypothetical protein